MLTFHEMMLHIAAYISGKTTPRTKRIDSFQLDLDEMIKEGLDPRCELRGANLSAMQFGERDVAGWDFTGTNLTLADLGRVHNIDKAIFSATTQLDGAKLPREVTIKDIQIRLL